MAAFRGPFCNVQVRLKDAANRQLMLNPSPLHAGHVLPRGPHEYGLTFPDIALRIIQPHVHTHTDISNVVVTAVDNRLDHERHEVTLTITCRTSKLQARETATLMPADDTRSGGTLLLPSAGKFPYPTPLMTSADIMARRAQPGPLIGVGVLILHPMHVGCVLVGRRRGSHGSGEFALPGGHLDYAESVETCAIREVLEETALKLDEKATTLVAVTQTVYAGVHKHYVTVFARCTATGSDNPINVENDKCDGWEWAKWTDIVAGKYSPLFDPLRQLAEMNVAID